METQFFILLGLVFFSNSIKSQTYAASNFTLVSHIDPEPTANPSGDKYSACWGWYQASLNKEYAIACSQSGTYWIDVTNPSTPTVSAYRLGAHNGATWREVKNFQNYCYVASDDGGTNRFQIFDMQYLPDSVHKVYDSQSLFKRGHTLYVSDNKLYVASVTYSNNSFSSMNVYSLANPASPVLIRRLDQDVPFINHVHDMYVRNDTVYASCGFDGLYVLRLTPANTFSIISSLTTYPSSGYNHSSALTPNGQTLVFLDEVPASLPIKVANVSNLSNIQVLSTINQFSLTTPHNPFVVNNQYCFVSSYQDGLQLFDISNPSAPFLAGYFDTYPQGGGNNNTWQQGNEYEGQWGAYPFFPSKNIFALDQKNGVFMLSTLLYHNSAISPTVSFVAQNTVCVGSAVNYTNNTSGASSYFWTFQGGTPATSTLTNPSVTYSSTGLFNVILSASNGSVASVFNGTVSVKQVLAATSSSVASCSTCSNGIAAVNAFGGTAPYTYTWLPTGGNSATATALAPGCYTVQVKDAVPCSISKTVCVSFVTGLTDIETNSNEMILFPNPAKTSVSIESRAQSFSYSVIDHLGRLINEGDCNSGKVKLDISDYAKGIYLVEIIVDNTRLSKKLIIE